MYYQRSYNIQKRFAKAIELLQKGNISAKDFANKLEVSSATASRVIAELRRRGKDIETIRKSNGWFYKLNYTITLTRIEDNTNVHSFLK